MLKISLLSVVFLFSHFVSSQSLPGKNHQFAAEQLSFTYQSFDGGTFYKCEHSLEDPLAQDWMVSCGENNENRKKLYRVHLWVKEYRRSFEPELSLEILYWVTDRSRSGKISGHSSTHWIHMREAGEVMKLQLSQGVDQDLAGLYLKINLD